MKKESEFELMRQIRVCLSLTVPPALTQEGLKGGDGDDFNLLGRQAEAREGQATCPWS